MTLKETVPFELHFDINSKVATNLFIRDLNVQEVITISDNCSKIVLKHGTYLLIEYIEVIDSLTDDEVSAIKSEYPDAVIEDSIAIHTIVSSNKEFDLIPETLIIDDDPEKPILEFSSATVAFH